MRTGLYRRQILQAHDKRDLAESRAHLECGFCSWTLRGAATVTGRLGALPLPPAPPTQITCDSARESENRLMHSALFHPRERNQVDAT